MERKTSSMTVSRHADLGADGKASHVRVHEHLELGDLCAPNLPELEKLHSYESKSNSRSKMPYAVAEDSHVQHSILTVNLTLTRTSAVALRVRTRQRGQAPP